MKITSEKYKYNVWLVLLLGLVVALLICTTYKMNQSTCNDVIVNFENGSDEILLSQNDILKTIKANFNTPINGRNLQTIDLELVEEVVEKAPFVKQADAFFDSNNTLNVNIIEKRPLVRVINSNNVSYYIDNEGNKFEVSPNFTVRVVLASGFIKDDNLINAPLSSNIDRAIFELTTYINENQLWKAMIEQIYVEANGDFVLIPKVGDFEILLGDVTSLELKFKKLENFYNKDVNIDQQIEVVNLKYNNQILCELKQPEQ